MKVEKDGAKIGSRDYENNWRAIQAHYTWLCQIKHPTIDSVVHDTSSSVVKDAYVVMAMPNVLDQDAPVKANIAILTLIRTHEAIQAIVTAFGLKDEKLSTHDFSDRFDRARVSSWTAFVPFLEAPNPISIHKTRFAKKYPPVP